MDLAMLWTVLWGAPKCVFLLPRWDFHTQGCQWGVWVIDVLSLAVQLSRLWSAFIGEGSRKRGFAGTPAARLSYQDTSHLDWFRDKNKTGQRMAGSHPKQVLTAMPFQVLELTPLIATLTSTWAASSRKASKRDRQHCIQKCNRISGNTQRLQGWGLGIQGVTNSDTASRQSVTTRLFIHLQSVSDPAARAPCSQNAQVHG